MSNEYYVNTDGGLNEARILVQQKSYDELQKLVNNDGELTKLIMNISEVQQMEAIRETLKERIKQLALSNSDKEPKLISEKAHLRKLYDKLQRAIEKYKAVRKDYEEKVGETNPEMVWVLLQTAASELERSTEEIADDFFYGQKTEEEVAEFERRFLDDRKRAHELKIKAEKFRELLQMSGATSFLTGDRFDSGHR